MPRQAILSAPESPRLLAKLWSNNACVAPVCVGLQRALRPSSASALSLKPIAAGISFGKKSLSSVSLKSSHHNIIIWSHPVQELRRQAGAITGLNVFLNPAQNLQSGARPSKSLYQYTLQAGNLDELFRFAPLVDTEIRKLPALQDISSDLQIQSPQTCLLYTL